jgi:signal transduction histidine kinase
MKKISLVFFLFVFQLCCFGQGRIMDSLKAELKNAKEDTAKLRIYLAIGNAAERKDKLLYAEPAWKLVDELFVKEKKEEVRLKLIEAEKALPDLVNSYYSNNDSTDWNKAITYLVGHLQAIEKTGDKKRIANFLFSFAAISLDQRKDSASFRTYILKSIGLAKEIKDSALILDGYGYMCAFYKSAGSFSLSLEAAQSSMAVCRQLNYARGIARSHRMLAALYGDYGEDELALSNYQASLDIAYKIKDAREIYNTLIPFGGFYSIRNNMGKALEYFTKILELCRTNPDLGPELPEVYRMIGEIYKDSKDYKNALTNFEKSLARSEEQKNYYNFMVTVFNMGEMYSSQGDFEKAASYHTRAIQLADSIGSMKGMWGYLQYSLAQDYIGLKKYDEAKKLNDIALVDFKKHWFDVKIISQMELLASQIDSARGDGPGALAHYKEYVSLTDKIRGDEIKKAAQKDKFKEEMEKQKAEQEKKDAIAKRTRNLQYAAIGAFLLLGIFLAYGYVQKNKDKKKIEKAYAELKSTQSQLIQSEKMASLGELTAGIAHEIQNPLNFVNNFSEVNTELIEEMKTELKAGNNEDAMAIANDIAGNEQKINHHGKRADAIVKGMLQHSRSSSGVKEPTDINALADEYLRLAYHGLRAKDKSFNATMKTDFDESIGSINIIPQDMGRVILNLITNAFYVVDEKKKAPRPPEGGVPYDPTVSVSTKKVGDKVLISVKDNGNGIPQKVLDKIFQPFFTTKPTGQGTGLGLSLSYDIVKAHGGELKVETKEGEGSTFIIQLQS